MLAITRKAGESVQIGSDIRVFIGAMRNGQVKLGIDAPKDILILRSELVEREKDEQGDINGNIA